MLQIPTEARFCFNPPVCPPLLGSMGHQLLPRLNSQGRTIDAILPGGNCLFRSISKSLFGTSSGHLHLRKLMVTFTKSNIRLLGGLCNPPSIEEHCKRMETPGTFGTQAELQATAFLFQVPVYLYIPKTKCDKRLGMDGLQSSTKEKVELHCMPRTTVTQHF